MVRQQSLKQSLKGSPNCHIFQIFPTTLNEVNDIKNLKQKNSSGYDDINQNIVIECADYISETLSDIINSSLTTVIGTDKNKIAKVISIYKSASKSIISNYSPIYNLPIFPKYSKRLCSTERLTI